MMYNTQVAENPNVRLILRQLVMDRRACEVYIRPLTRYPEVLGHIMEESSNGGTEGVPFLAVAEYLRGMGDTAIGCAAHRQIDLIQCFLILCRFSIL